MRVGIQGFAGCFHQMAAQKYFGEEVETMSYPTFEELITSLRVSDSIFAAVMAIENSIVGVLTSNESLLKTPGISIKGEVTLSIRQHLMALPKQSLSDIVEVHSQDVALRQCEDFLNRYPYWKKINAEDTALSAKNIREKNLVKTAAIASELAAKLYRLNILASDIHSQKENSTRFLIIQKEK